MSVNLFIAPKGKYRVIEVDMWAADGFSGNPEEAVEIISDYTFLWFAKWIASRQYRRRFRWFAARWTGTNFHRYVCNDRGEHLVYVFGRFSSWREPFQTEDTESVGSCG